MQLSPLLNAAILWVHLFSAVLFVGGSFFIWLVVMPASDLIKDELERMRVIEKMARRFGKISGALLILLIVTGVYNASWYLPSTTALFDTYEGNLLLVKVVLVILLVALVSLHGGYYGRKIITLSKEEKFDELKAVRRQSRILSGASLVLMVAILILAVALQIPP